MIPSRQMLDLKRDLSAIQEMSSTVAQRRACKKIIREAESLLEKHPAASNRFRVLGIMFKTQKLMLSMRQTVARREALLQTARRLRKAPDEYAELRVEPDMMLLQLKLATKGYSAHDSAFEVARFADRYRDTPAEAESLMMAASLAFDLGKPILLDAFRKNLAQRFRHEPQVNAFMRERFAASSELHLHGEFLRSDGQKISFPIGQTYVVCFWSRDTPLLEKKIAEIKAMQERYKDQFKVFSFNLDSLPDYGKGKLKRMGLDWVPLQLPGGVANPVYRSTGAANMFSTLVVGPYGLVHINATRRRRTHLHKRYEATVQSPRQVALLRSLCVGDFLVADLPMSNNAAIPREKLQAIQECFPPPPKRYRLTPAAELKNYETAAKLCAKVATKHSNAPDLWAIHNRRIIALLGIWRFSGETQYLDQAVDAAEAALALNPPSHALTVPNFCMAAKQLVCEGKDISQALSSFIQSVGGEEAPGAAHAAAFILALEAHSYDQCVKYRDILLNKYADDPSARPVTAFVLEPSKFARVLGKALPNEGKTLSEKSETTQRFKASFSTITGQKIVLPDAAASKMTALVFMEEPANESAAKLQKATVDFMADKAADRPLNDLQIIGLFRSNDTENVAERMKQNQWSWKAVCLAEDKWSQLCRELGIVAADCRPNIFLLRSDGGVVFATAGIGSDPRHQDRFVTRIAKALRNNDLGLAEKALAEKDFREYAARLETSFPLDSRRRSRYEAKWEASCAHRRKLVWAYIQVQDWQRALDAVNVNIATQKGSPDPRDKAEWCRICHGHLRDTFVRVVLLRKMGNSEKAKEVLASVDVPKCPHGKTVDALWKDVRSYVQSRPEHRRFRRLKDPKVFLAHHERNIRSRRQGLYDFKLEHDLMLRAQIYEKMGKPEAAERDRRYANALTWPYDVREYAPELTHNASVHRREQAREYLQAEKWERALALANRNIEIHESEAIRCNSQCRICGDQIQSFQHLANTLEKLGRTKEAEASRAMAEHAQCPPGEKRERFKRFPVNRMYGGGSGINRVNFILKHMKGKRYSNQRDRMYRLELASDLNIRARALEEMDEKKRAANARERATALAYPHGPAGVARDETLPQRYVDLLNNADLLEGVRQTSE